MTDELHKELEITALEKKLLNERNGKDYVDNLRRLSLIELGEKLKDLAKYRQAIISTKKKDKKLATAQATVNGLMLPYTQDLRGNTEKARFVGLLIQESEGFDHTREIEED